jgi:hypothetical protein
MRKFNEGTNLFRQRANFLVDLAENFCQGLATLGTQCSTCSTPQFLRQVPVHCAKNVSELCGKPVIYGIGTEYIMKCTVGATEYIRYQYGNTVYNGLFLRHMNNFGRVYLTNEMVQNRPNMFSISCIKKI